MSGQTRQVATTEGLFGAVAQFRQARRDHPEQAIDIELQAGTYRLERTLELEAGNTGQAEAPLLIRSAPGERAVLTGSLALQSFAAISSPEVRERLTAQQRDHLVEVSMADAGIAPIETIEQRGQPPLEQFHQGRRLPLARYPEEGWLQIEDVPQDGLELLHEGLERE